MKVSADELADSVGKDLENQVEVIRVDSSWETLSLEVVEIAANS